jgi:hypothetical protein
MEAGRARWTGLRFVVAGYSLRYTMKIRAAILNIWLLILRKGIQPKPKFKFFIFTLVVVTGLSSYLSGQSSSSTKKANRSAPTQTKLYLLEFERTECLGTCPAYKIKVTNDGTLFYEGKMFVKTKGKVTSRLTREQLFALEAAVEKARYFNFRNSYSTVKDGCNSGSDDAWAYTSIRFMGRKKSISHYYGCRSGTGNKRFTKELKRLSDFETEIDRIINVDQWIGSSEWRDQLRYRIDS